MTKVFILHHVHEIDDGHEDVKLIGVYRPKPTPRQRWKLSAISRASEMFRMGFLSTNIDWTQRDRRGRTAM
jgi:hypothetical protein